MTSRREFIRRAAMSGVVAGLRGTPSLPRLLRHALPDAGDPSFRELVAVALDAARSAGASYADVRFTVIDMDFSTGEVPSRDIQHAVGVRALVRGNWGFAAGAASFSRDDVAHIGRDAALQATTNAWGSDGTVQLGAPPPVVANGVWTTPIKRDPFTMPLHERADFLAAVGDMVRSAESAIRNLTIQTRFTRAEKTYGSTLGTFTTQTRYLSSIGIAMRIEHRGASVDWHLVDRSVPGGFEVVSDIDYVAAVPVKVREAFELLATPVESVEIGRYAIVCDGAAAASLLDASVATATELDRALGYEANASGTSYLGSPSEMLGTFKVGSPLLTVTAERSSPSGLATIGWDDDGVVPRATTLVEHGVLTDYQTTRELATSEQLASWYRARGWVQESHGYADSQSALCIPMLHTANIALAPGAGTVRLDELVADTKTGYAFIGGRAMMDQQCLNGQFRDALVRRIENGKLGAVVPDACVLFRAPSFWKNLIALGGASSSISVGCDNGKGEPGQLTSHTTTGVPIKITEAQVANIGRRA